MILVRPQVTVADVAVQMADRRVNHLVASEHTSHYLPLIGEKLARGGIFGMERILPAETSITYRRLESYPERCKALDDLATFAKRKRLRGRLRENACAIMEELLMNAMYQAPVNEYGDRYFENLTPKARLKRRTPRPVSVRYACHDKRMFICVRDRYGSLARDTFSQYLTRCVATGAEPERKRLGAGLGLYLVTSHAAELWINVLPGGVTEFVCVLEHQRDASTGMRGFFLHDSASPTKPLRSRTGLQPSILHH